MKVKNLLIAAIPAAMLFGATTGADAAVTLASYATNYAASKDVTSLTADQLKSTAATVQGLSVSSISQVGMFGGGTGALAERSRFANPATAWANIGSTAQPTDNGWLFTNQDSNTSASNYWRAANGTDPTRSSSLLHGIRFTLTVDSGYELDLSKISYDWNVAANGTTSQTAFTAAYYSTDGTTYNRLFADKTMSVTGVANETRYGAGMTIGESVELSALTGTVTIQLLFDSNTVSSARAQFVRNISIDGTVTQVPEPSTYALIGGIAVAGIALVARRRKQK